MQRHGRHCHPTGMSLPLCTLQLEPPDLLSYDGLAGPGSVQVAELHSHVCGGM